MVWWKRGGEIIVKYYVCMYVHMYVHSIDGAKENDRLRRSLIWDGGARALEKKGACASFPRLDGLFGEWED